MQRPPADSPEKTLARYMTGEIDQNVEPMRVERTSPDPEMDDNNGQGLTLHTSHGDLRAIWHEAPGSRRAVVLASGAGGGFNGCWGSGDLPMSRQLYTFVVNLRYRRTQVITC